MNQTNKKIEVLSPAGSMEALRAAISAGCDAIYIGGSRFGARAYADNPEEDLLVQGIQYAHRHNVRVYLTVNTLVKETELHDVVPYLKPYYEAGLDAVIVQDLGVLTEIVEHFPDLAIHASTQMTIFQEKALELLPKQVTRVVPARELTMPEIVSLSQASDLETEVFVHGALCYCYSGQCLMSSMIGGRSGNRGRCAQPCRKEYRYFEHIEDAKNNPSGVKTTFGHREYALNLKDQCLLSYLPELIEAGVDSLKIEGRMKRPEYTAIVTGIYRKWVDRFYALGASAYRSYVKEHVAELKEDMNRMEDVFSRGEYWDGYAGGQKGPHSMVFGRSGHIGTIVGEVSVNAGRTPTILPTFTISPEAADLIVLRAKDKEGLLVDVGELTLPKDITTYRPRPIPIRWDHVRGPVPERVTLYRVRRDLVEREVQESFLKHEKREKVDLFFFATPGEPMCLTVNGEHFGEAVSITVSGAVVEVAKGQESSEEQVRKSLMKMGGTEYEAGHCEVSLGERCFLPVSVLNSLRREALESYTSEIALLDRRKWPAPHVASNGTEDFENSSLLVNNCNRTLNNMRSTAVEQITVITVSNPEQAGAVLKYAKERRTDAATTFLLIDMEGNAEQSLRFASYAREYLTLGLLLPRATKGNRLGQVIKEASRLMEDFDVHAVMVRSFDQLAWARKEKAKCGLTVFSDSTIPLMNRSASRSLRAFGVTSGTISLELRKEEITKELAEGNLLTVYGRTVLMVSEQCLSKNNGVCDRAGKVMGLKDGEGVIFPVKAVCKYCYNIMYNGPVLSLLEEARYAEELGARGVRYDFTLECGLDVENVLYGKLPEKESYTKGHWKRGVE